MSRIDVLGILEKFCAGDDGKYINVLLDYINELEDGVGIIDKLNSLYGDKIIIRALEGYASFLEVSLVELECEDEYDEYDEKFSTDYYTELREYHNQPRKFENTIKGTDYAYGGFMSEDDDL